MKPKPFSPLNHFTEPVAIENPLLPWPDLTRFLGAMAGATLSSQRDFQSVMVVPSGRTRARWAAQSLVWRRIGQMRVLGPALTAAMRAATGRPPGNPRGNQPGDLAVANWPTPPILRAVASSVGGQATRRNIRTW